MPDIQICTKCREECNNPRILSEWCERGWYCPAAGIPTAGVVLKDSDPPAGCLKLFEQAVAKTLSKKSKEEKC